MPLPARTFVFLSYRSLESDFAFGLASALKNLGISVWMDKLEHGIRTSDSWDREIETAIDDGVGFVAVLSPDYVKSDICRKELSRAHQRGIRLFAVLLQPLPPQDMPLLLDGVRHIDFTACRAGGQAFDDRAAELGADIRTRCIEATHRVPDPETRYLNRLISDLQAKRGVLQFLELDALQEARGGRCALPEDEWGFSVMLDTPASAAQEQPAVVGQGDFPQPRVVLLGAAGSGKSTALRRIALDAARARQAAPRSAPLPLVVNLALWTSACTWADFLSAHWPLASDLAAALRAGDVQLFLDGLNEMGALGPKRARDLNDWLEGPDAPARISVACREEDYQGALVLKPLQRLRLLPLTDARIGRFARNYLSEGADPFLQRIDQRPHRDASPLRDLCRNPYMLSALIYLASEPTAGLPGNMGKLFQRLTGALWAREQMRGGTASQARVDPLLGRLAFDMMARDAATAIAMDEAERIVGSREPLDAAVRASLVVQEGDALRFSHQLLQEYFAATALIGRDIGTLIERPTRTVRYQWRGRLRWDNAVMALLGISADTEGLIREIGRIDPELLSIWAQNDSLSPSAYGAVVACLDAAAQDDDWTVRCGALLGMRCIKDRRFTPRLVAALRDPYSKRDGGGYEWKTIYPVRRAAAISLRLQADPASVPALVEALADPDNHWATPWSGNTNAHEEAIAALRAIATPEALDALRSQPDPAAT